MPNSSSQKIIESCSNIQELCALSDGRIKRFFNPLTAGGECGDGVDADSSDDDDAAEDELSVPETQCCYSKRLIAALKILRAYSGINPYFSYRLVFVIFKIFGRLNFF